MPNRTKSITTRVLLVPALAALLALAACKRAEAPTPGVAGDSANAPAAANTPPTQTPQVPDAQVGAGKSPGGPTSADRIPPAGTTGTGGAATGSDAMANTAPMAPASAASGP